VKRAVLLAMFLAPPLWAAKGDSAPYPKMTAPAAERGGEKPAPSTDKRNLHLQLKK
jgi:hypothetical protein